MHLCNLIYIVIVCYTKLLFLLTFLVFKDSLSFFHGHIAEAFLQNYFHAVYKQTFILPPCR